MGFFSKLFGGNSSDDDDDDDDIDNLSLDNDYDNSSDEYYDYCSRCGDEIRSDDNYSYDDSLIICESCLDNGELIQCDECETYYESDYVHYDEYSGNYYCESCSEADIPDYDDNGNSNWWRDE